MTQRWMWETTGPGVSGSSGDLGKMFKNESVKQHGAFSVGAPPAAATLLAREVIQNSWDAARELQRELQSEGEPSPDFEITFKFRNSSGAAKQTITDRLGLAELADRADQLDRSTLGLRAKDSLSDLASADSIPLLEISESGTTGMYGPFTGPASKMYLALVSLGFTNKGDGAGGSYGYGKAGLIRGSATRTVVAYSCFRERADDPGVTRRLLGMTYWGPHQHEGAQHSGFARFGSTTEYGGDTIVVPFENNAADDIAATLGLELRDAAIPEQLGTTFVLLDPTIEPDGLRVAIERNWWPAIEQQLFDAVIIDDAGVEKFPRPRSDELLATFIRALEVATVPQDNRVHTEKASKFQTFKAPDSGGEYELGVLGLKGDPDGWSYPAESEDEESVQHRSLVALIRGPRMVVEYLEAGRARPFVRGVFIAANGPVDDLLRQTEPKAHDSWETTATPDGADPDAAVVASVVTKRIKNQVNNFRGSLKPPVPDRRAIRLPELEKLFQSLFESDGSKSKPPPHGDPRDVTIAFPEQELEAVSKTEIRVRGKVAFALSSHVQDTDSMRARVGVIYKFLEDDRAGRMTIPLDFKAVPPGFSNEDGSDTMFVGELSHEPAVFEFASPPYAADWSGRLIATGDLIVEATGEADE